MEAESQSTSMLRAEWSACTQTCVRIYESERTSTPKRSDDYGVARLDGSETKSSRVLDTCLSIHSFVIKLPRGQILYFASGVGTLANRGFSGLYPEMVRRIR